MRAEKLACKFETITKKHMATDEDEPKSQAYYVIKAAQEREDLQKHGDELEAAVRKAEKEVAALEATLRAMTGTNASFYDSTKRVDANSSYQQRAELREQLDKSYDRLKFKRADEAALARDVAELEARVNNARAEASTMARGLEEAQRRRADAQRVLSEQSEKLARAKRTTDKLAAKVRGSELEADIAVAEARETNRAALTELKALAAAHPEAGIAELLEQAGIKLPGGNGTPGSSRPASRAGSVAMTPRSGYSPMSSRPTSSSTLVRPGSGAVRVPSALRPTGL